jgi:hypothetical protein
MKVTVDNIKDIDYINDYHAIETGKKLLRSLLVDIEELNQLLIDKNESYRQVYIDYENKHTEYSPERTDPCPDYYGLFTLRFIKNPYETIGEPMTLDELDSAICLLINFTEFKLS